jgi:hypothetical protein
MRHLFVLLAGVCACAEPAVEITSEPVATSEQGVIITTKVPYWDVVPPMGQPPDTGYTGVLPGQMLRINATSPVYVELSNPSYCYGHESIVKVVDGWDGVWVRADGGAAVEDMPEYFFMGGGNEVRRFLSTGETWVVVSD